LSQEKSNTAAEQKGGFYVVEGLDGSGKSTQIELLLDYIRGQGLSYQYLHFPRTNNSLYGDLIARYLRGDLGPLESVHPYLVALIFAGDRHDAGEMIREWLSHDEIVITDRYVISNIAFQCAKLKGKKDRVALKNWILNIEYEYHGIPRPDMNIFLDVPFGFTKKKLTSSRQGEDRDYLRGNADIHEQDLDLQKKVREVYLEIVEEDPSVRIVNCGNQVGEMRSPQEIFSQVRKLLFQ
jgi:dTMP kinase